MGQEFRIKITFLAPYLVSRIQVGRRTWEKILNFNVLKMILEDFDGFVIKVIKEDEFQEATDVFMEVVEGWNILKRPSKKVHGHCIDSFCS